MRGNIAAAFDNIPGNPIQVSVTTAGVGRFNITFDSPAATDVDQLIFTPDVTLLGAVAPAISTVTDGQADTQYTLSFDRISGFESDRNLVRRV